MKEKILNILTNYKHQTNLINTFLEKEFTFGWNVATLFPEEIKYIMTIEASFKQFTLEEQKIIYNRIFQETKTIEQQSKELNISTSSYYNKWNKIIKHLDESFQHYNIYLLDKNLTKKQDVTISK